MGQTTKTPLEVGFGREIGEIGEMLGSFEIVVGGFFLFVFVFLNLLILICESPRLSSFLQNCELD